MQQSHIECQGLPCPQPVLKAKDVIESQKPDEISIVVDNEAAKINVSRFLGTQHYEATVTEQGEHFIVKGVRNDAADNDCEECKIMNENEIAAVGSQKILIFIPTDTMGSGDDELGTKLMYNFLLTLKEMGSDLWRVVLVNGGVKLAVPSSPSMKVLKELEDEGVSVLVCGTCLEFFNLTADCGVGEVTNMLDIVTSFQLASKTIRV